ncbi:MAG: hypothetical protein QOI66_32 [Myxococcales bacterium]|nr:hypothetical protein [Myxococcales bacterium]
MGRDTSIESFEFRRESAIRVVRARHSTRAAAVVRMRWFRCRVGLEPLPEEIFQCLSASRLAAVLVLSFDALPCSGLRTHDEILPSNAFVTAGIQR